MFMKLRGIKVLGRSGAEVGLCGTLLRRKFWLIFLAIFLLSSLRLFAKDEDYIKISVLDNQLSIDTYTRKCYPRTVFYPRLSFEKFNEIIGVEIKDYKRDFDEDVPENILKHYRLKKFNIDIGITDEDMAYLHINFVSINRKYLEPEGIIYNKKSKFELHLLGIKIDESIRISDLIANPVFESFTITRDEYSGGYTIHLCQDFRVVLGSSYGDGEHLTSVVIWFR